MLVVEKIYHLCSEISIYLYAFEVYMQAICYKTESLIDNALL